MIKLLGYPKFYVQRWLNVGCKQRQKLTLDAIVSRYVIVASDLQSIIDYNLMHPVKYYKMDSS